MPEQTDDDPIVREEAAALDAEGNKRAAEDKAEVAASRTALEKADDASRKTKQLPKKATAS